MLLGLFADLMVNRGEIPAFHSLSPGDQKVFQEEWKEPLKHFPPLTLDEIAIRRELPDAEKVALAKTYVERIAGLRTRL